MAEIIITNHPTSTAHKLIKAIARGRVYAVTSAEPFPTIEEAKVLWREQRRLFRPYDETTGRYLGGR
jgi:hypothetical protein